MRGDYTIGAFMTKKEYQKLLQSDYWKGYSYSLIKERDFTCEDCGRRFFNERHKLQVHHLVYRDVNPWSYSPDEVVVLCEDCHKKRHGIVTEPVQNTSYSQTPFGEYNKDYSSTADCKTESIFSSKNTDALNKDTRPPYPIESEPRSRFKFKYVIYSLLLLLCIMIGRDVISKHSPISNDRPSYENGEQSAEREDAVVSVPLKEKPIDAHRHPLTKKDAKTTGDSPSSVFADEDVLPEEKGVPVTTNTTPTGTMTVEKIDEPKQEEPSRELSTLEILERRNHADVVKQAKRAGVSTEGSTLEILERINHADVVKQAKRAGVSAEGSTLEILERINHADVVKQAKRAGVSTEGSTLEILERINRKEMEKYNELY